MNNASPGHRLFEAHADQGLLQGKQQVTTLRLEHVSCWLSWRSCSISWHSFSPWQNMNELASAHGLSKALLVVFHTQPGGIFRQQRPSFAPNLGWIKKKFVKDRGATRGWRTCSVCSPVYRFVLFLEYFCIFSILHYQPCGFVLFLLFAILAFLFATYSLFFFFFLFDFSCVFLLLCFSFSIIKRYILRPCFVRLLDFAFSPYFSIH